MTRSQEPVMLLLVQGSNARFENHIGADEQMQTDSATDALACGTLSGRGGEDQCVLMGCHVQATMACAPFHVNEKPKATCTTMPVVAASFLP